MYAGPVILYEVLDVEEVFGIVLLVPGFDDNIHIAIDVQVKERARHDRILDQRRILFDRMHFELWDSGFGL